MARLPVSQACKARSADCAPDIQRRKPSNARRITTSYSEGMETGEGSDGPINPVVISETQQDFEGRSYYLCGKYFRGKGDYYIAKSGSGTEGQSQRNFSPSHRRQSIKQRIENLDCLSIFKHQSEIHGAEHGARLQLYMERGQEAARIWHGSKQGIEWHKQQYELHCKPLGNANAFSFVGIASGNMLLTNTVGSVPTNACAFRRAVTKKRNVVKFLVSTFSKSKCSRECGAI